MPEIETERLGSNAKKEISALQARVTELERIVNALVRGFVNLEEETGDAYMPPGKYSGVEFHE